MANQTPHSQKWSSNKKYTSILTGLLEHILFCGLICGWNNIQYVYQQSCYCLPKESDEFELKSENETQYNYNCGNNTLYFYQIAKDNSTSQTENNFVNQTENPDLYKDLTKQVRNFQQYELAVIQRFSVQTYLITAFLWGFLYDNLLGTRKFRIVTSCLIIFGCFIGSLATLDNEYLLWIAIPLIQIGGTTIHMTNLKLNVLIPKIEGVIMQLMNGAYGASACTFLLAKLAYIYYDFQANQFLFVWGCFALPYLMIRTFFLMPNNQIIPEKSYTGEVLEERERALTGNVLNVDISQSVNKPSQKASIMDSIHEIPNSRYRDSLIDSISTTTDSDPINIDYEQDKKLAIALTLQMDTNPISKIIKQPERSFWSCIKTRTYLLHTIWFVSLDYWNMTFYVAFLSWATWMANGDDAGVQKWTNAWAIIQFTGLPFGIFIGSIYDKVKRRRESQKVSDQIKRSDRFSSLQASSIVCGLTTLMGVLASFTASFQIESLQWITMLLQLIYRCSLYGNNAQALLDLYPRSQFAKLLGLTFLGSFLGAEACTQLVKISLQYGFSMVYKANSVFLACCFIYPVWLYLKSYK